MKSLQLSEYDSVSNEIHHYWRKKGYQGGIVSKCLDYCDKTPIDWRLNALGFALKINELCDKML